LAIGVAAAGLDPGLELAVRARIEAAFPPDYASFLAAAQRHQASAADRLPDPDQRSAFWRQTAAAALTAGAHDWDVWLAAALDVCPQAQRSAVAKGV
jgi:siroheme synthase (precorrin-2 oxidase/ferrochelatase)